MRLLHAELPQYLAKPQEALDRLYHLKTICLTVSRHTHTHTQPLDEHKDMHTLWYSRNKKATQTYRKKLHPNLNAV